ncbi:MAG: M50 family metallopeptidase [Bacteroidetes bacterium]|nr:M50 family metallopeptidase [Bacteroidota bacterium]
MDKVLGNHTLVFYILLAIALFLTRIPVIGKYFRSVNTLIHEGGHAFMTLLVSGEVIAVNLFADTSGNTITKAKSKFFQVLISLAGYPVSAACGLLFLFLLSKGYNILILFVLVSLTLLLMVLSIRNAYGLFWSGTFTIINLLLIYFNQSNWVYLAAAFFSLIVVVDSVLSSVILFVISIKTPKKAGDASNLEKFTKIPAVIWSILLLAFSGYIAYLGMKHYFPPVSEIIK